MFSIDPFLLGIYIGAGNDVFETVSASLVLQHVVCSAETRSLLGICLGSDNDVFETLSASLGLQHVVVAAEPGPAACGACSMWCVQQRLVLILRQ